MSQAYDDQLLVIKEHRSYIEGLNHDWIAHERELKKARDDEKTAQENIKYREGKIAGVKESIAKRHLLIEAALKQIISLRPDLIPPPLPPKPDKPVPAPDDTQIGRPE